jgi:TonB family C-terminal domain
LKEGDLVPAGTEGLAPPEIISQYRPPYPPMARAQRVQGVVIISALVSETGRVLNVTILRGVPQLNDVALEAVRRSTFRPATKDGVRVKAYKNVTVPFKL